MKKLLKWVAGVEESLRCWQKRGFLRMDLITMLYLLDYCKKQNLKVFYLDATKAIPKKYKLKYKLAGIAINTLFNFPKNNKKKVDFICI